MTNGKLRTGKPLRIRLTLDRGLAAYLRALVNSDFGIFGDERETLIYLIRGAILELVKNKNFLDAIHLPEDIRQAWGERWPPG